MSRLFAFMHSLNFAHEIGLAGVPVFDNKSLKANKSLFLLKNNLWLLFNQSKNDTAITAQSDFFQSLSTKLSTAFVDNRESDSETIS